MPLEIRLLQQGDRDEWLPLWRGYLDFYETTVADGVTEATWTRIMDPEGPIHAFGAFDDAKRMMGLVHYLFHPVTWSIAERCFLEDLFVSPAARGTGAGQALIEAVYRAADEAGADQVYWLTATTNATARKLYDRVARATPFMKYQR